MRSTITALLAVGLLAMPAVVAADADRIGARSTASAVRTVAAALKSRGDRDDDEFDLEAIEDDFEADLEWVEELADEIDGRAEQVVDLADELKDRIPELGCLGWFMDD